MNILANIVCKTAGIAGMSAVLYDAYTIGRRNSSRIKQDVSADYFQRIHAAKRTLTTESQVNSSLQNKISDLRMNNPIVPIYGNVKGFLGGFFNSLGNNIIPVCAASLALAGKGAASKIGAWGLAAYAGLVALREGFGVGKNSPMD